jgi:site-specific DNA-methyltransferase (adenine-specific)
MRWLVKLVTPPGGIVLDPFSGSGTTLAAATLEGFDSIGVELNPGYIQLIEGRVRWARDEYFKANRQLQLPW